MQLNKKLLLLLPVFVISACSKKVENKLLLEHWAKNESHTSVVERKLATGSEAECMVDTFTEETLKAEIASIEEKYKKSEKLKGKFEHLDYSDLPVTQGNFLNTYGNSLGDQTKTIKFDYSSCKDVPCIINKIYGQDSGIEGHAIYLWYLKMGNILAVDNFVYGQNSTTAGVYQGKNHPLSDYLFSKDELYAFWRMSHMLSPAYKTIVNLKEIQRVPRGEAFEGRTSLTCGLAWSNGWVQLSDSCLDYGWNSKDSGFIYEAVTHELAHEIDYQAGAKIMKAHLSEEPGWLNASGWVVREERVGEGQLARVTRIFSIKPGFNKFVSSYSQTSPAENFADTLSHYIHSGDHTKNSIPEELYTIVKAGYYGNDEYTLDANIAHIIKRNYSKYVKDILDMTVTCLEPEGEKRSTFLSGMKFTEKIPASILNCIGNKAEILEKSFLAHIKITEPEGCNISKIKIDGAKKLSVAWKTAVAAQVDEAFARLKDDSEYLARIKQFYENLSGDTGPQKMYVSCFGEPDEKSCYDTRLKDLAQRRVEKLKPNQLQAEEMISLYIDSFPFLIVEGNVKLYYQNFLKSQSSLIVDASDKLWRGCYEIKNSDESTPTGTLFNVGTRYMVSSMYNCLNYRVNDSVLDIVRNVEIDGAKIQDGKEELILKSITTPLVISELQSYFQKGIDEEKVVIDEYIKSNTESLRQGIQSNYSWATNYVDNQKIISDCKAEVLKSVKLDVYFHQKSSAFAGMLLGICEGIPESSEFNKYLDSIKGELEGKAYQTLEGYVLEAAGVKAKECLVKFPVNTSLNRIKFKDQREKCLKDSWPAIEKTAIERLNSEPLVVKFKIDTGAHATKLKSRARVLQLKTFKEYFEK